MNVSPAAVTVSRACFATLCLAALLLGVLFGAEAVLLGPLATPERVSEYRFGTEAMVGHGGIAYASRTYYVAFSAVQSALFLAGSFCSWRFIRRGRVAYAWLATLLSASSLAIILFA